MASPLVQALSLQSTAHPAQSPISPTDVLGAYNLASSVAQKNYEAKLAQQNAKFGGMAQLGGAAILAGGPTAYSKLFGGGVKAATEAAPAAASSTTAAAPTVAADMAAAANPADTGGLFSGIFGGAGTTGAGAGTVGADLAAAAPAATGAAGDALAGGGAAAGAGGIGDALASLGLPEWLASALPFLAAV